MRAEFEDWDSDNSYLTPAFETYSDQLNINPSIENVDRAIKTNGARTYALNIREICDEAGNCNSSPSLVRFNYEVYANTTDLSIQRVDTNELEQNSNIADGSPKELEVILRDAHGNNIVPASGI